jgi:uncharacterized protein
MRLESSAFGGEPLISDGVAGNSGVGTASREIASHELSCRVVDRIATIPAAHWDRLAGDDNPFLRHDFLGALERTGCVGHEHGWLPRHLLLEHAGELLAACPTYLKSHSFGEFVFDWGWAEAYERNGLAYYPKLLCAVPFTPATGPRMLCAPHADRALLTRALVASAVDLVERGNLSSAHWLFPDDADTRELDELDLLRRWGCQFHWHNPGYRDFQDYLDALTSKRRKQVRKERREAAEAPVLIELKHGDELDRDEIAQYHELYCSTYDRKWGQPSLTLEFFLDLARNMPRALIIILARRGRRVVAGAHLLRGRDALFGRNWGCSEPYRSLHFEICYYRGIEYCIEHRLARFEAGAQGEHKLMRGFMPVRTHSFHWIRDPRFRDAIGSFLARERRQTEHYMQAAAAHTPFRLDDSC